MDMRHSFIKCFLISWLQTCLKHVFASFISILYVLAKSSALVIQLVNPCNSNGASGIWCNMGVGWGCPHPPYTAKIWVVASTLSTQRMCLKETRSKSCKPDLETPRTLLPYVRIDLTRESNIYKYMFKRWLYVIVDVLITTIKHVLIYLYRPHNYPQYVWNVFYARSKELSTEA